MRKKSNIIDITNSSHRLRRKKWYFECSINVETLSALQLADWAFSKGPKICLKYKICHINRLKVGQKSGIVPIFLFTRPINGGLTKWSALAIITTEHMRLPPRRANNRLGARVFQQGNYIKEKKVNARRAMHNDIVGKNFTKLGYQGIRKKKNFTKCFNVNQ